MRQTAPSHPIKITRDMRLSAPHQRVWTGGVYKRCANRSVRGQNRKLHSFRRESWRDLEKELARSDLLLALVRAANLGDTEAVRRVTDAVVAEERAKQHHVLADRLVQAAKQNGSLHAPRVVPRQGTAPAVLETTPTGREIHDLILPDNVHSSLQRLIEEQRRADVLRSNGLEPRHRILFTGPPGNGKTATADALAFELAVPLLTVRYESLVTSLLGETSTRLHAVFEHAQNRHCVLFFDEFDTLAKERGDEHETGEIKRVVSTLLLQVDALPSYVVVVVATNHPELLDRAVWRRFQLRLEFPPPSSSDRIRWFETAQSRGAVTGLSPRTLAMRFRGASFSDMEDFTLDWMRRSVLEAAQTNPSTLTSALLKERQVRFEPAKVNG
jgi:SpoVK/Ycf46/Vps4 family AAA+-type ATPase